MLKRSLMIAAFLMSACVTVNIYFPAAAVERAADQIVKETWGGPTEPAPQKGQPQSRLIDSLGSRYALTFISRAHAQEADINVSNPAIRALKDSIKNRSEAIKPFMDKGSIGIAQDGLLAIRSSDGLNLKERAETKQLVDAENNDREALYIEIAKANGIPKESVPKIKSIFAKSWSDQARPGWYIQDTQGNWRRK
ncbi:MAG: DUF1318 domain-containing protein [Deltaproteobacteria bacterium]|nr:DUF1318 domain-containing protein [Deltaproteobacteria bacterium]